MSRASGVVLILAGVGAAAYMMPGAEDADQQVQTQEVYVVKGTSVAVSTAAKSEEIVPPIPQPAVRPAGQAAKAGTKATTSGPAKPTVVSVVQRGSEQATVTRGQQVASTIRPGDRVGLTRELQRELKRVGCYDGEINGTWTPTTRRAMKAFTDRVNAILPIEQPDYILLTLVQGRQERACGAPCPAGQVMADDDRCLPQAVMAQAAKKAPIPALPADKPVAATSGWSTTSTVVAPNLPEVPEGRMSLAGPRKDALPGRALPGEGPIRQAAIAEKPDTKGAAWTREERDSSWARSVERRRSKPAVVEKPTRRYAETPRRKFGPWFFQQRDAAGY